MSEEDKAIARLYGLTALSIVLTALLFWAFTALAR